MSAAQTVGNNQGAPTAQARAATRATCTHRRISMARTACRRSLFKGEEESFIA